MQKIFSYSFASIILMMILSFQDAYSLKGTWEFRGGIYNGKKEGSPTEYTLQRKYSKEHYEAFLLEKGSKPVKYETGDYVLKGDTCVETETFSIQPSKLMGIAVSYLYTIHNDTLTLRAKLPSGMTVEEYWQRTK